MRELAFALLLGLVAACASPPPAPPLTPEVARISAFQARGIVLSVNFDLNSYAIRPDAQHVLDPLAEAMNDPVLERFTYEINGHTDSTGRLGRNVALSELRAAAVLDYLAGRGVVRSRLRSQGFGPLQPIDPANPRAAVNRRVEVFALPPR